MKLLNPQAVSQKNYSSSAHGSQCLCAWCAKEAGIEPVEGQSHGICIRHRTMVRAQYQDARARRVRH
jgi:hypothetical protein